jgi:hypothetical protein
MLTTQSRNAKLWLAGSVGNWELAAYQADELKEGLEEAGKLVPDYKGIPVGKMVDDLIMPRIEEVESAIKARDRAKFPAAYDISPPPATAATRDRTAASLWYSGRRLRPSRTSPSRRSENRSRTFGPAWGLRLVGCAKLSHRAEPHRLSHPSTPRASRSRHHAEKEVNVFSHDEGAGAERPDR